MASGPPEPSRASVSGSPAVIEPTKVSVTVDETSILSVEVLSTSDTPGFTDPCIERIPAAIVENQSVAVDVVTGATLTSQAILSGVTQALTEAGADLAGFSAAPAVSTATETYEADVVIVGARGRGHHGRSDRCGAGPQCGRP